MNFLSKCILIFLILFKAYMVNSRSLDLAITIDAGIDETIYKQTSGFVAVNFAEILNQKVSPIIVSGVVFHQFIQGSKLFSENNNKTDSNEHKFSKLISQLVDIKMGYQKNKDYRSNIKNTLEQLELEQQKIDKELENYKNKQSEASKEISRINGEFWQHKIAYKDSEVQIKPFKEEINKLNQDIDDLQTKSSEISDKIRKLNNELMNLTYSEFRFTTSTSYKELRILGDLSELIKLNSSLNKYYFFANTKFNFYDWEIYKHIDADLYLLVPNEYYQKLEKSVSEKEFDKITEKFKVSKKELILGLNVDHTNVLQKIDSFKELEAMLNLWASRTVKMLSKSEVLGFVLSSYVFRFYRYIDLNALESLFIKGKDQALGNWNILMYGHGNYSVPTRKELKDKDALKSKKFLGIETSQIAGLTLPQFSSFLKFISQDIKTDFLYYQTCFGGGYHLDLVSRYLNYIYEKESLENIEKQELENIHSKNIIVSGSLTDAFTYAPIDVNSLSDLSFKGYTRNFKELFNMLDTIDQFKGLQLENHIRQLLNLITKVTTEEQINEVPSVWFPMQKKFKPIEIGEKIVTIDGEKKIPEKIVNQQAILVEVPYVKDPINILVDSTISGSALLKLPLIISITPGNATHVFERIEAKNKSYKDETLVDLQRFLNESIFGLTSLFKKNYKIKKLVIQNYENSGILNSNKDEILELNDVLIEKNVKLQVLTGVPQELLGKITFSVKDTDGKDIQYYGIWDNMTKTIRWPEKEYEERMEDLHRTVPLI